MTKSSTVAVCLWYDVNAEEAAKFYTSLVQNSNITSTSPIMVTFTLDGVPFQALNGGPQYKHTEAASISVTTRNKEETDLLWNSLVANGGEEGQCAWLKDRFGLSWQIVPNILPRLLGSSYREAADRAMQAMLQMRKIDIAALESAFKGS